MAESDQGEKTEEATQQRREDFRKRGQVAQTKELASVLILFSAILCIWLLGNFALKQIYEVFTKSLGTFLVSSVHHGSWIAAFQFSIKKTALIVGPIFGVMFLMAFVSNVVQVGFLTNEEAMKFKPDRLDPIQGLKRIFSMKSLVEAGKAVFKFTLVGFVVYLIMRNEVHRIPHLAGYDVRQTFTFIGDVFFKLFGGVGFFMLILAGLDYLFQRYDLEQKMKMTKQEVKEEFKSREGDPLIKSRIKRVQRELANKRMMEDVPKADVIVTNPTHIAIALRYSSEMIAPTVVAKGAGAVAEKIKEIAKENSVPIVENKPLARAMFKTIKIGQAIPRELYTAVAEVLSYIYKLKKRIRA